MSESSTAHYSKRKRFVNLVAMIMKSYTKMFVEFGTLRLVMH